MIAFFQMVFAQFTGIIGISIVGILLGKGIIESMRHHRMFEAECAIIGGAAFYGLAWIISNWLSAATG